MSKKNSNLLGESQIRRMMGLAGIPSVNESEFIDTYRKTYFEEEEDEAPEAGPEEIEPEAEEPVEGEPASLEPDAPADEPNVETLVQALAQTITDVTGVQMDAGAEEPAAEEPAEPMADEPAADPMADEPAAEMGEEDPMAEGGKYKREDKEEEEEEDKDKVEETLAQALAAAGLQLELDNDEMVAEITKRVAARLVREAKRK